MKLRTIPATAMRRRGLGVAGRPAIAVSADLRLTSDEAEHDLDDRAPAAMIREPAQGAALWLQAGVEFRVPVGGHPEAPTDDMGPLRARSGPPAAG